MRGEGIGTLGRLFQGGASSEELLAEATKRREARRSEAAKPGGRSEKGKGKKETAPQAPTPVDTAPPESPPPSPPAPTVPTEAPDITKLAELYVKQYEEGSGVKLSEEAFQARQQEVATFYSKFAGGESRLDAVVFANDSEETNQQA